MFDPRLNLKRLEKSIVAFEQQPVEEGKILFVGSSAFTRWKEKYHNTNMEDDIRMKNGEIIENTVNPHPVPVETIEW